ncbi:4039_t:CDS:2 [Entrophospora sp. SA101]|nr:4039_t:CDS:2 [Entrophospora sp. SA101]
MPTNSNIVKTINNPNRFGPQPGGSLMNRTVPNPAQQANRPGPMNSAYLSSSMSQRTVGATPMMKVNGRIGSSSEQDKKNYSTKVGGNVSMIQPLASSGVPNAYSINVPETPSLTYSSTTTPSASSTSSSSSTTISTSLPNSGPFPPSSLSGQSMNSTTSTSVTTSIDGYGLLGLLSVIRMTDPDLNMLSLGSDLTSLGLNLNSPDSPWADNNQAIGFIEPEYHLPTCYNVQPPPPAPQKIKSFSDETLFYIFYSMPKDFLQEAAAYELFNRNWRFHKDLKLWLTKEQGAEPFNKSQVFERGTFIFFDPSAWEKFPREIVLMYDSLEDKDQAMYLE